VPRGAEWSFGGGTRLALLYAHRISYDVDIFVTDAQVLPYLSPRLNDAAAALFGDDYVEASSSLKLRASAGDIDIIVSPTLTNPGITSGDVQGVETPCQTAAEILAKKIQYRNVMFTRRDAFDLGFMLKEDRASVEAAYAVCSRQAIEGMRQRFDLMLPKLTEELPEYVNPTDGGRSTMTAAADTIAEWLRTID